MAFFKAKVLRQRKDGMYVVYIRVTQNRKSQYIRTSWIVDDMGLSKDKQDVIDPLIRDKLCCIKEYCGEKISTSISQKGLATVTFLLHRRLLRHENNRVCLEGSRRSAAG